MCHVDDACPRCGRARMQCSKEYPIEGSIYHCLVCGRLEQNPPPWPDRDRRKGERRGSGGTFKRFPVYTAENIDRLDKS